jgi:hypothetical protein
LAIAHANEASVRKNAKRRRPTWCCACTCRRRRQRKLDRPRSLHHYHPLLCASARCFLFSCSDALRKNLDCENGASAFQAQTGSKAETQRAPCALGSLQTRSSLFAALSHTQTPARERPLIYYYFAVHAPKFYYVRPARNSLLRRDAWVSDARNLHTRALKITHFRLCVGN